MAKILIINAHQYYPFAEGKLNQSLSGLAEETLKSKGHAVQIVHTEKEYDVDGELEKHQSVDVVLLQTPMNWMTVTWSFKKYMDDVYTAGMGGAMCNGDGRHSENTKGRLRHRRHNER